MNKNIKKYDNIVNKMKQNYNLNEINNNCIKTLKIGVKSNDFDVNEDKQRQCYKLFKCFWPKCRYSCNTEYDLNRHISHHLNKKQFVCEQCNKQFHQSTTLLQHKHYIHSTDRPFVCNQINCNKTFKRKTSLTLHNSTHSSVKNFGCDECDERFKHKSSLFRHKIRFHSSINYKRYKCLQNNCSKSFFTSYELKIHITYKHCTNKPYKCNLNNCNLSFKSPGNLRNHKKTVHLNLKINK